MYAIYLLIYLLFFLKKGKDIIACYLYITRGSSDTDNPEIDMLKKKIINLERPLLELFVFDFQLIHPHKYLVKFAKVVGVNKEDCGKAWSILEDRYSISIFFQTNLFSSYYLDVCIRFHPQEIALACLYISTTLSSSTTFNPQDYIARFECTDVKRIWNVVSQICILYTQHLGLDLDIAQPYKRVLDTVPI